MGEGIIIQNRGMGNKKGEEFEMNRYESSREIYAKIGVDTDLAIEKLKNIPVSLHCWQGDDVKGFDTDGP